MDQLVSLAENRDQMFMHSAEEIEAFAKLIEEGHSIKHVTACFGVPPLVVTWRMKLTRVSALSFMLPPLARSVADALGHQRFTWPG
ncbi:hypothetical protein [Pseudomonas synxantha]|uniref:Transposase n=1 Tax=Pseudomonas synxantha TaxID=47883 RepID=A0AAU8U2S4_9PSED|nr:hypothetical protein [Pseudomonas synxantha]AKA85945.1 hypothetical protein VO64_5399 [Pseudomonas synxantha]